MEKDGEKPKRKNTFELALPIPKAAEAAPAAQNPSSVIEPTEITVGKDKNGPEEKGKKHKEFVSEGADDVYEKKKKGKELTSNEKETIIKGRGLILTEDKEGYEFMYDMIVGVRATVRRASLPPRLRLADLYDSARRRTIVR